MSRRSAGLSILILLSLSLAASVSSARTRYPHVVRDAQGTWIATDSTLIHMVGVLWTFYTTADGLPSDRVRMVAPDDREVWAATSRGSIPSRRDSANRRCERYGGRQ